MDPEDASRLDDNDAEESPVRQEAPNTPENALSNSAIGMQRQQMVAVLSGSNNDGEREPLPKLERLYGPATAMSVIVCRAKTWCELSEGELLDVVSWSKSPGMKIWYMPNMRETHEQFVDPLHPISNRAAIDGFVLRDGCEIHYPDALNEVYLIVDHHMGDRDALPSACKALQRLAEEQTLDVLFVSKDKRNINMLFHDIDEDGAWSIAVVQMWDRLRRGIPISDEAMQTFRALLETEDRMDVTGGSAPDVNLASVEELKSVNLPLARQRGERRPKTLEDIYGQIESFLRNVQSHLAGNHDTIPLADTYVCARVQTEEEPWAVVAHEDPDARQRMRRERVALAVIHVGEKAGRHLYSSFLWDAKRMPICMGDLYAFLNRAEHLRAQIPDTSIDVIQQALQSSNRLSPVAYWAGNGAGGCHTLGSGFTAEELVTLVDAFCRTALAQLRHNELQTAR